MKQLAFEQFLAVHRQFINSGFQVGFCHEFGLDQHEGNPICCMTEKDDEVYGFVIYYDEDGDLLVDEMQNGMTIDVQTLEVEDFQSALGVISQRALRYMASRL